MGKCDDDDDGVFFFAKDFFLGKESGWSYLEIRLPICGYFVVSDVAPINGRVFVGVCVSV
jgi:hypothetical protein